MHQVHNETRWDEAHRQDHGDRRHQVCVNLGSACHLLLQELLRLRQWMGPHTHFGPVITQEAKARVVPEVLHRRDRMIALILEPERHVRRFCGATDRDSTEGPGQVSGAFQKVPRHHGGLVDVLELIACAPGFLEGLHHLGTEVIAAHVGERHGVHLIDGDRGAAGRGPNEHVGGEAQGGLRILHRHNFGEEQGDEDEEGRQQELRGPSAFVTAHRESALPEEGSELLPPKLRPRDEEVLRGDMGHGSLHLKLGNRIGNARRLGNLQLLEIGAFDRLALDFLQVRQEILVRLLNALHALRRPGRLHHRLIVHAPRPIGYTLIDV
mmetsp:Transcript_74129/g.158839  ORF Transcript_74129/g.158839 Transcript_74129/m.158839 type:complete len:324 (-) Transcript_74129:335-1306(-)